MNITVGLAIALALSTLANLWLFNSRDNALQEVATQRAANTQLEAVGNACSASVDKLAKDGKDRGARLEKLIAGKSGEIVGLQQQANAALAARPSDPNDLCKSLAGYFREELRKERAAAKDAKGAP